MNYREYTLRTPSEIKREEERLALQERTKSLAEQRDKAELRRANYNKFIVESKDFIVIEAMNMMLEECLPSTIPNELRALGRNCCTAFVKEEGVNNILKRCKSTLFLNEFMNIVEETHKEIVHGAAESEEDDFAISNSVMQKYYDKLRTLNYGPMCNTIINRVTEAEKEFIEDNIKDRERIEDATEKAAEKIKNVRSRYEDTEEKIKEEYAMMLNKEVNRISTTRRKNILESIINRLGKSVMDNENVKDTFLNESGKLDTPKVIESGEVMYTFLEMVNTCNFKPMTIEYIESVLKSIK